MQLFKQDLFKKNNIKCHSVFNWVAFLLLLILLVSFKVSLRKGKIKINEVNKKFGYQDYDSIYLNATVPVIWAFKANDNYSQQISISSDYWDTLVKTPSGNPVLYSFWREAKFGFKQISNLNNKKNKSLEIGFFSPIKKADTIISGTSLVKLKQYQSVEYFTEGLTTVRFSSNSSRVELVYCIFGIDSVIPIALNTSKKEMPEAFKKIKNLVTIESNQYQIRNRWGRIKIFIVYLPMIDSDFITVDFFKG